MKDGIITWEERVAGALQDFKDELSIQTSPASFDVKYAVELLLKNPAYVNRLTAIISNDSGGMAFPHFKE